MLQLLFVVSVVCIVRLNLFNKNTSIGDVHSKQYFFFSNKIYLQLPHHPASMFIQSKLSIFTIVGVLRMTPKSLSDCRSSRPEEKQ